MLRREFLKLLGLVTAAAVVPWPVRRFTSHIATQVARPGDRITIVFGDGGVSRAVTWNREFKLAAPFSPVSSQRRTVQFMRDKHGHWLEISRSV